MKKLYVFLALGLLWIQSNPLYSQQNVGIGTTSPDQSAVLDLQSSNKGLLIPRMSLNQRSLIDKPAEGLMIFQTDQSSGFYFYDGKNWKPLTTNEAKSVATVDANGWALDGNATTTANKIAATASSFIGTPSGVPINFKVASDRVGVLNGGASGFVGLGYRAGNSGPGNGYNIAIGANSMASLTTGNYNVGIGSESMRYNTIGIRNFGLGSFALRQNTTGNDNTAVGYSALRNNIDGNGNLGIGLSSLQNNTAGSNNIGLGFATLYDNTTGGKNVAIGYQAGRKVQTGENNIFLGYQSGYDELGSNKLYISNSNTTTPLIYGDFSAQYVAIGEVTAAQRTQAKATGSYNLLVKGGILTEKVKVALATTGDWADYVFEPSYNLMSLESVESFVAENKHLPNVPSAEEMATNGLDVSQTSKMFMEKIEELTLYMIELNKEMKSLKAENEVLKSKLK